MGTELTDAEARQEHRLITDRAYALLAKRNKTAKEVAEVNRLMDAAAELYSLIARGHFIDDDMKSTQERSSNPKVEVEL